MCAAQQSAAGSLPQCPARHAAARRTIQCPAPCDCLRCQALSQRPCQHWKVGATVEQAHNVASSQPTCETMLNHVPTTSKPSDSLLSHRSLLLLTSVFPITGWLLASGHQMLAEAWKLLHHPGLMLSVFAEPEHDPLFGTHQWSTTTASEDPRDPPRIHGHRYTSVIERRADAANDNKLQAWTLSSLEATPLEASSVAASDGSGQPNPAVGFWSRLSTGGRRSERYSWAQLPSGFVVDDLQSSSAALPLQSRYAAASEETHGSHMVADAVHELHDPEGRGTGAQAHAPRARLLCT